MRLGEVSHIDPGRSLLKFSVGFAVNEDIVVPLEKRFVESVNRGDFVDRWLWRRGNPMSVVEIRKKKWISMRTPNTCGNVIRNAPAQQKTYVRRYDNSQIPTDLIFVFFEEIPCSYRIIS